MKAWIETAINLRKRHLEDKYGEEYMKRNDWDVYDYCENAGEEDATVAKSADQIRAILLDKQKRSIEEMLDALVYCAFDAEDGSKQPPFSLAYTDKDDDDLSNTANGRAAGNKRTRPQHMETVRPKSHSAVPHIASK